MIYVHPYNDADVRVVVPEDDRWFITHEQNGDDVLQFELDHGAPYVDELVEETYVKANGQYYVVKSIEDKSDFIVYTCEINKDDFKQSVIEEYLEKSGATTGVTLARHLTKLMTYVANDWTYSGDYTDYSDPILLCDRVSEAKDDSGMSQGMVAEPLKRVTPLEILDKLSEACGCIFNFDTANKTLLVVNPNSAKRVKPEVYFTDELNVVSVEYVGTSSDLVTRMYGVGKEAHEETIDSSYTVYDSSIGENKVVRQTSTKSVPTCTFTSINGGKAYVDDFSYTDKVVSAWYVNEDCVDAQQLLKETKEALAQACQPKRSYSVKLDNGAIPDAQMYDIVWVVDSQRDLRMQHQIVTYKEYPAAHHLDEITLSQEPMTISKLFKDMQHHVEDEFDNSRYTMEQYYLDQIQRATDMINGSTGGTFIWITNPDGKLRELVNLGDSDSIKNAKQVWRWNEAGLGHSSNGYNGPYDLALLKDGSINATMITTGTLNAVRVKAGILQDINGYNYWNMETGEFRLRATSTMVGTQSLEQYVTSHSSAGNDSFATATAREVFNKLTNNGAIQGITMDSTGLYINATYINSGTLSGDRISGGMIVSATDSSTYWNLSSGKFQTHTTGSINGQRHNLYLQMYHAQIDFLMDETVVGRIRMRTGGTSGDPNYHNLSVETYSSLWLAHNGTICSVTNGGPGGGAGTLYSGATEVRYYFYTGSASGSSTRTVSLSRGAVGANSGLVTGLGGSSSSSGWSFTC